MAIEIARAACSRRLLRWQPALTRLNSWASRSRPSSPAITPRRFSTEAPPAAAADKPYYITTPIFYVNAAPHIGHMYSMVLADVFKRWHVLRGNKTFLCTGTDEHGMKVQQAAARADVEPKEFCDENAKKFEELAQLSRVEYDRFIRTTDHDHVQAVEHFWFLLRERGFVYEAKHEGWYSVSDESFYPESQVIKHQDPFTGAVYMASAETKNKVEWVEEKNYCFRMTDLKDKLLDFYEKNPGWIEPAYRMNEVVDWVKNHLEDLSISRPIQRLTWGIRTPDDPTQTIYVWVDALINYLTAAGYPNWIPGEAHKGGWPADLHIIGKDILRFHCVYWPALLMALDLPLPRKVLVHSHWTLNKKKMSKSLGNVVNPLYAINRWGVDTARFYLLSEGGIADDADYNNNILVVKYKKYLQSGFGNLLGRVTRSKAWNLSEIVKNNFDETKMASWPEMPESLQPAITRLEGAIVDLASSVAQRMDDHNPVGAIRKVLEMGTSLNQFLTQTQPWALVTSESPADKAAAERVLFLAAEGLRISGILLQPFLPVKAGRLLDILGVGHDSRTFSHAVLRCDSKYGVPMVPPGIGRVDSLFPPLIEDMEVNFGGSSKNKSSSPA